MNLRCGICGSENIPYRENEAIPSIDFIGRKCETYRFYCCTQCAVELLNYIGKREEARKYEYEEKIKEAGDED
jgi:hypothetical protein